MRHLKAFSVSLAVLLLVSACSFDADSVAPGPEPEAVVEPEPERAEEPVLEPEPTSTTELLPEPTSTTEPPPEPPVPLEATYVFGEKVSPRTQTRARDALAYAASFVEGVTGYKSEDFTLFVFMESEPLVEHYMSFYNIPSSQRSEILSRWQSPRAEAGRGNIFMLLGRDLETPLSAHPLSVFTHEYVHVIQWSFAPDTQWGPNDPPPIGPIWLVEGVAEYFAFLHRDAQDGLPVEHSDKDWVPSGIHTDAPLRSMESWPGVLDVGQDTAYALGTIAAHQLAERYGIKALLEYSEAVGTTGDWRRGFEQVFGLSVEQFYEEFEDSRD